MFLEDRFALAYAFCLYDVLQDGEVEHLGRKIWEKDVLQNISIRMELESLLSEWKCLTDDDHAGYHVDESKYLEVLEEIGDPIEFVWTKDGEWFYQDMFEGFCDQIGYWPGDWDWENDKFAR